MLTAEVIGFYNLCGCVLNKLPEPELSRCQCDSVARRFVV